jgi:hypothetical protein
MWRNVKGEKLEVTDYCPFQGTLFVISKES